MTSVRELLGEEPTTIEKPESGMSIRELLGEEPAEVKESKGAMSVRELLGEEPVVKSPTTIAPLVTEPIHPAASYLEKFTKPRLGEFDKYQMAPLITAENVAPAMDTLGRLWNLAQHPYDVVKGAAVFASEIPGFIGGLASAIGQIPIEILKGGTVLDWYNASAKNMQTISGMWHKGVSAPLGKLLEIPEKMGEELAQTMFGTEPKVHKDETELMGEIFMVPYTAVAAPLHEFADSSTWDDYPNIKGILKFGADALGLVTMGLVLKGGPVMAARKVDPIVKKAHDIETRQTVINVSALDEVIKTAQKKILDAEKVQLELEIEGLKKELDTEKLAKEDLKEKGKEVEGIREERLKFAEERASIEKLPEGIEPISKTTIGTHFSSNIESLSEGIRQRDLGFSVARNLSEERYSPRLQEPKGTKGRVSVEVSGRGLDYNNPIHRKYIEDLFDEIEATGKGPYDIAVLNKLRSEGVDWIDNFNGIGKSEELHVINQDVVRITDIDTKVIKPGTKEFPKIPEEKVKTGIKLVKKIPSKVPEPITDLDLQTGVKEPPSLSTESSPFRETPKRTQAMKDVYAERAEAVRSNPELMTNKLLNDVNRWLDGEDLPVEKAKNDLSELAARTEELERSFISRSDFLRWKDTVSAAANWARKADRSKIERPDETKPDKKVIDLKERVAENLHKALMERTVSNIEYLLALQDAEIAKLRSDIDIEFLSKDRDAETVTYKVLSGRNKDKTFETKGAILPKDVPVRDLTFGDVDVKRIIEDYDKTFKRPDLRIVKGTKLYTGLPVDKIKSLFRGFHGTSIKYVKPSEIVGKTLIPKSLKQIVEDTLDELKLVGNERDRVRQKIYDYDYFEYSIKRGEGSRPFDKVGEVYVVKDFSNAAEYAEWAGEAYDNALIAVGAFDKSPTGVAKKAKEIYDKNRESTPIVLEVETPRELKKGDNVFDHPIKVVGVHDARTGTKLYTGLPIDEAVKQLKSMAKHTAEFMKEFKGSFKEKEFDFAHAVKQVKADTLRSLWDQSETLLNIVKNKYPEEYNRVVTRQRSAVTGIGYGKVLYGQAVKEIYGGKSKEMIEATNAYIFARRFKDIYSYRPEKGYKHQPGYGATQTINTTAMIEMIKDIPPEAWGELSAKVPEIEALFGKLTSEEMVDVVKGGEAYFEWSRRIVDDIVAAGIKTPEEGVLLKAHDFRKFKTMLVKKLYDFNYDLQLKGETIKVNNSGVLELGAGNTKIIEPDSRVVLSEQMARAYGSIAHQAAALEWKGLADRHSDNGFVSRKRVSGWSPIPYMEDGVRKNIYFHPDAVKYLVTRSRDLSPRLAMAIRGITLAPVTRSLAVGLSPIWSTFAGLPMDVMHSLWTARTWEADAKRIRPIARYPFYETRQGKFRKVYSPFAGVDALQIGTDMKRVYNDVYNRGPLTVNLMKHGLVMNFLTQRQNRYMKGVKPPGDWAKTMDLISYHGLTTELWVRVATADRVIRRDAKKRGITYEQALKNDDIMYRAAHAGRDRMDYNQGGWFVKALDQSGMIFLNAAVLGTRTFWRQAIDNPVDFTFRATQLGITAAGLTAVAWSLYPETMKDMSEKGNRRDVTWPIAPNWLRVKDRDGDDISFYFKLRMDPNAAFLYRMFEGLTRTYMYDQGLIKEEPDYKELVKTLKHLGPVDVKLPPAIQASVDYVTNYSWWRERQMYTQMGGRTFDWPESQFEGKFDERVPQMAKDIAKVTKLSPKRLAGTASNVIPSNNEFVWLMGGAYEQAFSDLPEEVRKQHWLVTLAETPGFNKVIGITRHGQGRWKVKSDIENEIELRQMVMNSKFDMLAKQNAWYGVKNKEKLFKFMKEQEFDDYNRMVDVFKFIKDPAVKSLPHRDFWLAMKHSSIEGRAKTWIELLGRASESEKKQLMNELSQVMVVGGVVTPEFMEEVSKLRSP